jgi:formate/nitrite transporter FocA (FNT family)
MRRPGDPPSQPPDHETRTHTPDHGVRREPPERPEAAKARSEVEELSAPEGAVVYGAIHQEGTDELKRSTSALAWSGLAAGLSMGFSFAVEAMLQHTLPDSPWRPLVSSFGYSVGFLIVVLGRQQLFTENTLTVILPLLRKRDLPTLGNVARLWAAVLLANLFGALLFAIAIVYTRALPEELRSTLASLGAEAMQPAFSTVFVRGIFAGWLIALMVWLLPYAESSRVWVILIISYVVGLARFSHVIVGSVETLYLVVAGTRSVAEYAGRFLIPALLGNIVGGVSLVAALAHAQFVAAADEGEERVAVNE